MFLESSLPHSSCRSMPKFPPNTINNDKIYQLTFEFHFTSILHYHWIVRTSSERSSRVVLQTGSRHRNKVIRNICVIYVVVGILKNAGRNKSLDSIKEALLPPALSTSKLNFVRSLIFCSIHPTATVFRRWTIANSQPGSFLSFLLVNLFILFTVNAFLSLVFLFLFIINSLLTESRQSHVSCPLVASVSVQYIFFQMWNLEFL